MIDAEEIVIQVESGSLGGILSIPENAKGIVLFAHGSGSGRFSPRNQFVAKMLQDDNIATLLMDLLTEKEEEKDDITRELRFDIPFLAKRLLEVTEWAKKHKETKALTIGYFGASTGAAAALIAASDRKDIKAIVSRGGRPDLAGNKLSRVTSPTLLIVGGADYEVIELNQQAFRLLTCEKKLEIVPNATHLFEEPGTLNLAAKLAANWFTKYL